MKRRHMAGIAVLLLLLVYVPGNGCAAVTDATEKQVIWNAGQEGFVPATHPGTMTRNRDLAAVNITPGTTTEFAGPLTVPVSINGEKSQVTKVYLNCMGYSPCNITHIWVSSGNLHLADYAVFIPPPGAPQTITFELDRDYEMPNGLVVAFDVQNPSAMYLPVFVFGYGAKIKFRKT